jgi:ElaB/YqjD/DUF883 family membrane-anchored ribosome-binding protein
MRSSNPTANSLARDTQNVVSEAQELLKTVKEDGMTRLDHVRSSMNSQLDGAREKFGEIQTHVTDSARMAYDSTDTYVRSNPWTAVAIAAAAGAVVGFLASRR